MVDQPTRYFTLYTLGTDGFHNHQRRIKYFFLSLTEALNAFLKLAAPALGGHPRQYPAMRRTVRHVGSSNFFGNFRGHQYA